MADVVVDLTGTTSPEFKKQKTVVDVTEEEEDDGCVGEKIGNCSNCFSILLDEDLVVANALVCSFPECKYFICLECSKTINCKFIEDALCQYHQTDRNEITKGALRRIQIPVKDNTCMVVADGFRNLCSCKICIRKLKRMCDAFFEACKQIRAEKEEKNKK